MVGFASFAASPLPIVRFGVAGGGCADRAVTAAPPTPISVAGRSEFQFKATLTGLSANTTYCYRVFQGEHDLLGGYPSATFRTTLAPGDPTPFSFAVVGDWGAGTPDETHVLGQIAAGPAQFVVTVGDNVYGAARKATSAMSSEAMSSRCRTGRWSGRPSRCSPRSATTTWTC